MSISLSPAEDAGFGFMPSPSGSGEVVLSVDEKAIISFFGCDDTQTPYKDLGRVAIVCEAVLALKHGYPNDEPRSNIPSFKSINSQDVFIPIAKILNNDWESEISEDNRHKFPNTKFKTHGYKHLVFQFKESTAEVLCQDCRVKMDLDWDSFFEFSKEELYG